MISVTILAKNSELLLEKVLDSIKTFDEVIILDNGSTDKTLQIAKKYPNVKIYENDFIGFGPMRNIAASLAKNDWILALDTDEILSQDLALELLKLEKNSNFAYSLLRYNFYNKKHIKWCGWHPERVVRLYDKKSAKFSDDLVHEKLLTENVKILNLKNPVNHYSYHTIDDFIKKMQSYSSLFAKQNKAKKKSSLSIALFHSFFFFFLSYFLKKGFLGGKEGFIISFYNANTAFYKYLKLMEINKEPHEK
ncbi:MAG: glycosyltransferase family 2 protein [Chlamydiae bacterium]|nr:glycosyltransferase family 2 protein [Chlamydiota bacterium]